jgi:Uncharacterised nucleotidyltransferase
MSEPFDPPEFSAELTLAIACSRWPFGQSVEHDIRALAGVPIDWSRFLDWVRRNRIAPLVYHNLRQTGCPSIPEVVVARLRSEAARNTHRVLMQIAEAARITRILADAGIRSMIIKGPLLSLLAFGDLSLRESRDIDLVLDPSRIVEADRLIVLAGYRRLTPKVELTPSLCEAYRRWRGQSAYYLASLNVILELHWRLTSNSLLMPDVATLCSRTQQVPVAGTSFATLPDEELFLYLCVHGSAHMWFRLKWLADISALLQQLRPEAIERIANRAQTFGLNRPVHVALLLAHMLMAAHVPSDILTKAHEDEAARKLVIAGFRALNWRGSPGEPSETPWFNTWLSWHAFRLKPGLQYRLRELQHQICSPEDWARVRLPEKLFFLYLPLRPLSWTMRKIQRLISR